MKMKLMHFKWTFMEGLLGTSTANEDIYRDYLASKAPSMEIVDEEAAVIASSESVDEQFGRAMTIFPKLEDGTPFQYDYQVKGYFKDTCGALNRLTGKDPTTGKKGKAVNESSKLKAFKKEIDGNIFVFPRCIPILFDGEITVCQRPLRASTPQGERVALAASEEIPAGATMEFWVLCMNDTHEKAVIEWMDYGFLRGTGQWRNSGKGRFTYELLESRDVNTIAEVREIVE
jgi:hypothetical protein